MTLPAFQTGETEPLVLPHNIQAEQALLGALLFEAESFERCDGLRPEHFFEPFHQRLFDTIAEAVRAGKRAEPVLIMDLLRSDPAFVELGGIKYLADLVDRAPPSANAGDYAAKVRELATARQLIDTSREIAARAHSEPVEPLVAEAERRITDIARDGSSRDCWAPVAEVAERAFAAARRRNGMAGVPTGIYEVDRILGGFRPKTYNLLAGRPGMGKTAAAVQLAINVARQGKGVGFFSIEEPEETLTARFACALAYDRNAPLYSGVTTNPTYEAFQRGDLTEPQWEALERGRKILESLPIELDFRSKLKPSQIIAAARRLKRKWSRKGTEVGLFIGDHIGHVAPEVYTGSKVQDTGAVSGDLLHAAKATEDAWLWMCQLSRASEGREDKRPGLSDLRWAGELEQDAFSVTFLYRPAYYAREPEDADDDKAMEKYRRLKEQEHALFWLTEKNRGGRTGQAKTFCDIGCNAIEDLEPYR